MPAPILMVHGAFCGGWAFDAFRRPFETRGHACHAPDLPGHAPADRGKVAGLSMRHYADAVSEAVAALEEPPILIGHSLGGLVCQLAAAKVRVRALVLLSPSAPWGVSGGSMEEAATAIGLMSLGAYWTQAIDPDFGLFASASADRLPRAEQEAAFARLVPESGRALFETFSWWLDPFMTTAVTAPLGAPPVLVIVGGKDQIHPPALVRQAAARCGGELRLHADMSHWLIGEPGWKAVADEALSWLSAAPRAAA